MAYYKGYNEDAAKEAANLEDLSEEEDQVNAEILDSFFADEEENLPEEDQEEVSLPDEDTAVTAADANRAKQEGTTVITKGTTINGSIIADCSLDIMGTIIGNIECLGKLSISGKGVGD